MEELEYRFRDNEEAEKWREEAFEGGYTPKVISRELERYIKQGDDYPFREEE